MRKISIIFLFFFTSSAYSRSSLPVLSSKQSAVNLRFFTFSGKNTYYQRRSGSLLMSTNYKVTEVMKEKAGSHFLLSSSRHQKKIIGQVNQNFHSSYGLRDPKKIFVIPYAGTKVKLLGNGVSPHLHLNDDWASFYQHQSKTILIKSLISKVLDYSIKINNTVNPYFVPQVILISPKRLIFTDINSKGKQGLILLDRDTGKVTPIFKVDTTTQKLEICYLNDTTIAMGIFSLLREDTVHSEISLLDTASLDASKRTIIYSSNKPDIGNILCSLDTKSIFFIQDQSSEKRVITNAVELDAASKSVVTLSDVNDATNMTYIDGMLLLPNKGKLLILKGHKNLKEVDLIEN